MALSVDKLLSKAKSAFRKGDLSTAEAAYREVLERFPKNKRAADGLKSLQQRTPSATDNPPQLQINAIIGLLNQGHFNKALQHINILLPRFPKSMALLDLSASTLLKLGRNEECIERYNKVLRLEPNFAEAHNNKGFALKELGRFDEAIESCQIAVKIKPDYLQAYINLGNAFQAQEQFEEAITSYRKTLELNPNYFESRINLGNSLLGLDRFQEAADTYKAALAVVGDDAGLLFNYGIALQALGRIKEAKDCYTQALEHNPSFAKAYRNYATVTKFQPDDPHINAMSVLLENPDVTGTDKMFLNFALGKAHSDIRDFTNAFGFLETGNNIRKQGLSYDISKDKQVFTQIKDAFRTDNTPSLDSIKITHADITPIFILGMPRSGTTLVEQIISSHSEIWGAGELSFLESAAKNTEWQSKPISEEMLTSIRNNYLGKLAELRTNAKYITDKMPANFKWIGFILKAFPNAKIIHVKRNPAATCWSNFKLYFPANGMGFTFDQKDIAHYYGLYQDIMQFWHNQFPNLIYDLSYEALTENQLEETQKLLMHLGLSWEDTVLDFHKSERTVTTASSLQVRNKIYTGSSHEWENYKNHLKPMLSILDDL